MTEAEKRLYNLYIAISRSARNKPYRLRKDFSKFEDKKEYLYVKKINNFLSRFPNVKKEYYFKAPFAIYPDQEYFNIDFFATQKAIKVYTLFMKQLDEECPDSDDQLRFIKDSLRFIGMFCIKQNIKLEDYINKREGTTYVWMKHIKNREVSIYSLFEFKNIQQTVNESPEDIKDILLGENLVKNLFTYKTRYTKSIQAKTLVQQGLNKIKRIVGKSLK